MERERAIGTERDRDTDRERDVEMGAVTDLDWWL